MQLHIYTTKISRKAASLLCITIILVLITERLSAQQQPDWYFGEICFQAGFRKLKHEYWQIRPTRLGPDTAFVKLTQYPIPFIGYRRFFGKNISVSLSAGYVGRKVVKERAFKNDSQFNTRGVAVLATTQVYWLHKPRFKLYSALGSGLTAQEMITMFSDVVVLGDLIDYNIHIAPVGFRWGRKAGLTGELSWGSNGWLQLGAFVLPGKT